MMISGCCGDVLGMFSGMHWECFRSDLLIIVQARGQRHVALAFKFSYAIAVDHIKK